MKSVIDKDTDSRFRVYNIQYMSWSRQSDGRIVLNYYPFSTTGVKQVIIAPTYIAVDIGDGTRKQVTLS